MRQSDYVGSILTDPCYFRTAHLESARFLIDGQVYPTIDFNLNFDDAKLRDWSRGYHSLFIDDLRSDRGIGFDYDDFLTGKKKSHLHIAVN